MKAERLETDTSPKASSESEHIGQFTEQARQRMKQRRAASTESRPSAAIVAEKELLRAIGRRYCECTLDNYLIDTSLPATDQDRQRRAVTEIGGFLMSYPRRLMPGEI